MGATSEIFKFAAKQIGMTALSVVTQKAGVEIGKVVVEKGTEEIKKRILKTPEQPVEQPKEPIKTGHVGADIAVNLLRAKFVNKSKKPAEIIEKSVETPIAKKAENLGNAVAEKAEQTIFAAKQIGSNFIKGFKK